MTSSARSTPNADAYLKAWNDAVDTTRTQGLILAADLGQRKCIIGSSTM
jgi:hypothetical protein